MNKNLVIMSGVSGSGKSYLAETIAEDYMKKYPTRSYYTGSADDFFYKRDRDLNLVYTFDGTKVGEAHASCFRGILRALERDCPLIIVDNTNTEVFEIAPYVLAGESFGYETEIISVRCSVLAACERNKHNVPEHEIQRQYNKIRTRELPSFWKITFIEAQFPQESIFGPGGITKINRMVHSKTREAT